MTLPARETNPTIHASSQAALINHLSASKSSNVSPVSMAQRSSEVCMNVTSEKQLLSLNASLDEEDDEDDEGD